MLIVCRLCGGDFPTVFLEAHQKNCPGNHFARAEDALVTSWVAACRQQVSSVNDGLTEEGLAAIAETTRRVKQSGDWGVTADVIDEWLHHLEPSDFEVLYAVGAQMVEDRDDVLLPEHYDDHRRAPARTSVQLGLMRLAAGQLRLQTDR